LIGRPFCRPAGVPRAVSAHPRTPLMNTDYIYFPRDVIRGDLLIGA
jgi:hypothetical protein